MTCFEASFVRLLSNSLTSVANMPKYSNMHITSFEKDDTLVSCC